MTAQDVLNFWFESLSPEDHFKKSDALDEKIRSRFLKTIENAAQGELFTWRSTAEGRLAEIIVLDQFSRNVYRDRPEAFAQDPMALVLAQEAVQRGDDQKVPVEKRSFFYMPYMHSESMVIHESAARLFAQPGLEYTQKYEKLHKDIIAKFGRYPHRNKILGRTSTPAEIDFLKSENSSF